MSREARFADVCAGLLRDGYGVRFRASGSSMRPAIRNGDTITVAPAGTRPVGPGDVVLYRRSSRIIAHRVHGRVGPQGGDLLVRGDAAPAWDDPVRPDEILGAVVAVESQARHADSLWKWSESRQLFRSASGRLRGWLEPRGTAVHGRSSPGRPCVEGDGRGDSR